VIENNNDTNIVSEALHHNSICKIACRGAAPLEVHFFIFSFQTYHHFGQLS
jgi:hypothetical protein